MFRIEFENTLVACDEGLFVRYRPVLKAPGLAEGSLSFASWDVAVGSPDSKHEAAKQAARDNVLQVLRRMVAEL